MRQTAGTPMNQLLLYLYFGLSFTSPWSVIRVLHWKPHSSLRFIDSDVTVFLSKRDRGEYSDSTLLLYWWNWCCRNVHYAEFIKSETLKFASVRSPESELMAVALHFSSLKEGPGMEIHSPLVCLFSVLSPSWSYQAEPADTLWWMKERK